MDRPWSKMTGGKSGVSCPPARACILTPAASAHVLRRASLATSVRSPGETGAMRRGGFGVQDGSTPIGYFGRQSKRWQLVWAKPTDSVARCGRRAGGKVDEIDVLMTWGDSGKHDASGPGER